MYMCGSTKLPHVSQLLGFVWCSVVNNSTFWHGCDAFHFRNIYVNGKNAGGYFIWLYRFVGFFSSPRFHVISVTAIGNNTIGNKFNKFNVVIIIYIYVTNKNICFRNNSAKYELHNKTLLKWLIPVLVRWFNRPIGSVKVLVVILVVEVVVAGNLFGSAADPAISFDAITSFISVTFLSTEREMPVLVSCCLISTSAM